MNNIFTMIINFITNKKIYTSIIIIVVGLIIYKIVKETLNKISARNSSNNHSSRRKKTYIRLFNSILKYLILIIVVVLVLQVNGVNVTSIIAGLGLVSVIAGLALQDALKDIIMGFNIIIDNYFTVGDILKIGDIEGKVIELGFKATKMKDINTDNIYTIANRNISSALILSDVLYIDVPLPYEVKLARAEKVLKSIVEEIKQIKNIENVEYKGLQSFGDSAVLYKIKLVAKPDVKYQARRDALSIIKSNLDKNNINIPYTQIDVHTK